MSGLESNVGQKAAIRRYFQFATGLLLVGIIIGIAATFSGFPRAWIGVAIIFLIWAMLASWYRSQKSK
ncbi:MULTISPECIES: hypothetical protein [unclassified Streptomyces]|uniref:hypothetical protein n=1 Tax=unclassified Streptomyces TaxID=2593676 RepID=UPI002E35C283|nr:MULTISPECIES: hypothetical protein [unclassified Streptomyces]